MTWDVLPPFDQEIPPDAQVLVIAGTGGAKSTLTASLLLDTPSLVAIDSKASLTLPGARIVELPAFAAHRPGYLPDAAGLLAYDRAVAEAVRFRRPSRAPIRLRGLSPAPTTNRVIVRPDALDVDDPIAHDRIFRAVYLTRPDTITWIDEVTGTGASAAQTPRYLRALSARGRTRGQGLWTLTQAAYSLVPPLLRRNATYVILGSLDRRDVRDLPYDGAELAAEIPRKSGRFLVYVAGTREPYKLYVPIPPALRHWRAP